MLDGLRARVAATQFVGLAAVVCLALLARARLPLGALFPIKAAACFAAVGALAVVFAGRDSHPFARFGHANQVTTARAAFVALVVGAIGEPRLPIVAASAAAAGLAVTMMDGVDGWLARSHQMASRFGSRFDMEVDALLILALAVLVWQHGKAGAWVALSGLLRYLFLAAGWLLPWMRRPLPPSRRRQAICVVQIVALILAIEPFIAPPPSAIIAGAALLALVYSFAVDIVWLTRTS